MVEAPIATRKSTRTGLPHLRTYFRDAWKYRTFAIYWSRADLKSRNFDTLLGRVWNTLNPLLFGLIYFVFIGIVNGGGLKDSGRLSLIVGNLYVWLFFSTTISSGVSSVKGGDGIMNQSSIPRLVLPAASFITAATLFARSLIAYIPLHILSNRGIHWEMLWIPYLVIITGVTSIGISLLTAVGNLYVRDISRILPHTLRLWMYLSPVVWPYTRVLDTTQFAQFNPMYPAISAWTMAFGGTLDPEGPGIISQIIWFTIFGLLMMVLGLLVFLSREDEFAVRN